jgi:hypothetical protein
MPSFQVLHPFSSALARSFIEDISIIDAKELKAMGFKELNTSKESFVTKVTILDG